MVTDRHDRGDLPGTPDAGGPERDELGTRATGEVIKVHASEHPSVRGADCRVHRVHPVLVYVHEATGTQYPKIQLITIKQLLGGQELKMPTPLPPYLQATWVPQSEAVPLF